MLVYSRALLYAVSFTMAWAVVTPAILGLAARFSLLVHTCGMLATAKVTKVAWVFSTLPYFPPPPYQQPQRSTNSGRWHTLDYRERHEDSRLRASQLEARLAMAQLQALTMQLHPHFLLNTLPSISELVHDDPPRPEKRIVRRSDFLGRYLEIEQIGFEKRLMVEWVSDDKALPAQVPNLILPPIVENALKHGIGRITSQSILRIACPRQYERLVMSVRDNRPGLKHQSAPADRDGVGLRNTRSRLERHDDNHLIVMQPAPAAGCKVMVTIPFRPMPEWRDMQAGEDHQDFEYSKGDCGR